MSTSHLASKPDYLYSTFGTDPDMVEIVDLFVGEMPERVASLQKCLADADLDNLRVVAHQLKGAGGSYGFQSITECAARVEGAIRSREPEEQIRQDVAALVDLCQRARSKAE